MNKQMEISIKGMSLTLSDHIDYAEGADRRLLGAAMMALFAMKPEEKDPIMLIENAEWSLAKAKAILKGEEE